MNHRINYGTLNNLASRAAGKLKLFAIVLVFVQLSDANGQSQQGTQVDKSVGESWKAPEWTIGLKTTIKNPTTEIIAEGEKLYTSYCVACHGKTGLGDGTLGAESAVKPANFHSKSVKEELDGPMFWKISEGRGSMPGFKTVLSDEQRWKLIAFIRQLSPKAAIVKTPNLLPREEYTIEPKLKSPYRHLPKEVANAVGSEVQVFMVDSIVTGLKRPWSMAFLPDNSMLITERAGKLLRLTDGNQKPTLIGGEVPSGLRDVKIHPEFTKNHLIYLSYYIEPVKPQGGYTVLMQGELKGNELVNTKVLYKAGPFKEGGETYGSRIALDKAGHLYFTVGQRTIDDRHRWKTVQDRSNPSGKVMRFNLDGTIPRDNPFVDSTGILPEIYTWGHRQPQGLIRHPVTGDIWESEHGEMGGSEVNLLQKGGNYGWPLVTFSRNYDGTIISNDTARAGMISPAHHWTPSIAPSDFDFLFSDKYPQWTGNLFIGAMVQGKLVRTVFKDGRPVHDEKMLDGIGRIRDVKAAPDGFLYLMIEDKGQIVRLVPLKKRS